MTAYDLGRSPAGSTHGPEPAERGGPQHPGPGHVVGPSPWPFWFGAASLVVFVGLALTLPPLVAGGLILFLAATVGWGLDASSEWRAQESGSSASAPSPSHARWGRPFAGLFVAIIASSGLAALFIAAPPSPGSAGGGTPPGSPAASATPAPGGGGGATITVVAQNIAFVETSLDAPANTPFVIEFDNQDARVPHNVQIKDSSGASVFKGEIVTGPTRVTYQVPALAPGTYTFVCDVHPTTMTGTITVK